MAYFISLRGSVSMKYLTSINYSIFGVYLWVGQKSLAEWVFETRGWSIKF